MVNHHKPLTKLASYYFRIFVIHSLIKQHIASNLT